MTRRRLKVMGAIIVVMAVVFLLRPSAPLAPVPVPETAAEAGVAAVDMPTLQTTPAMDGGQEERRDESRPIIVPAPPTAEGQERDDASVSGTTADQVQPKAQPVAEIAPIPPKRPRDHDARPVQEPSEVAPKALPMTTDAALTLMASGTGPQFEFAWPEDRNVAQLIWREMVAAGARAVIVDHQESGPNVLPADGQRLSAFLYSPLVRLTDSRNIVRRSSAMPDWDGYLVPRHVDETLIETVQARAGKPLDRIDRISGHIGLDAGRAVIFVTAIDRHPSNIAIPFR